MDKIILGLLMLRRFTMYEIWELVKNNFHGVYSDCLGSIEDAVKQLLDAESITYTEYEDRGVTKQRYSITKKGHSVFLDWVQTPTDVIKAKSGELGKFLFLGVVPAEKRPQLLDEITAILENKLTHLLEIYSFAKKSDITKKLGDTWQMQLLTLRYGIDTVRFQLEWFDKFRKELNALKEKTDPPVS